MTLSFSRRNPMVEGSKVNLILMSVLFIGIVSVMTGVAVGEGMEMDWNLSKSHASFMANDTDQRFGYSIAIAGDVNADGYDDILIGAAFSTGPNGAESGMTYLFFGGPEGWSMNINMSDADASFYGEAKDDLLGLSVSGVGDHNGDGIDDFMISGGDGMNYYLQRRRRAYLFYGNASGWSLNTNVSSAVRFTQGGYLTRIGDVNGNGYDDILIGRPRFNSYAGSSALYFGKPSGSFIANKVFYGENWNDYCGETVSGAGDVNGDGYNDFLISSHSNGDGGRAAGKTYLVLGGTSIRGYSLRHANATFLGSSMDISGYSLAGAGDVNGDGYDDFLISAHRNSTSALYAGKSCLFFGRPDGWSHDINLTSANVTFFGEFADDNSGRYIATAGDVNDDGYDDILIGSPYNGESATDAGQTYLILGRASYWPSSVDLSAVNASFLGVQSKELSGISIACNGDINGDGRDDILIGANSAKMGEGEIGKVYMVFYDDEPPTILDTTPGQGTTGDPFTISVNASDVSGVDAISVEYWFGGASTHQNVSMMIAAGDRVRGSWTRMIIIPQDSIEPLYFIIYARDRLDQTLATKTRIVTIADNDPCQFHLDSTRRVATTGRPHEFRVTVSDNINCSLVMVEYWFGVSTSHVKIPLTRSINNEWHLTIGIPPDSLETLRYYFYAEDSSTNEATTLTREITVTDKTMPVLGPNRTPDSATTGDPFTFSLESWDNIGIWDVIARYNYGSGVVTLMDLKPGDGMTWVGTIIVEDTLEDMSYWITVRDTSGNENATALRTVSITDNDNPDLIEDLSDTVATTGDVYNARVRVSDNIGVALVNSTTSWTPIDVDGNGNGIYELEIAIDADYVGRFYLGITVTDISGNEAYFELASHEVSDNDPPEIEFELQVEEATKGSGASLTPVASDNIGVQAVYIAYRYGDSDPVNDTVNGDVRLTIPRHPEGDLHFHFAAVDATGNWYTTEEFTLALVNLAPVFEGPPTWHVAEGEDATLNLEPFLSDGNDDLASLTVECSETSISVEGLHLKVRHDTVVLDYTVTLTVSDGEDQVEVNLTIVVVDVNDPPVITFLHPENGTKVKEGKRLVLSVTTEDEDGDHLTVTWTEDGEVIGDGPRPEVKLKPGKHVITVVVDDGTDQVEENLTLIVKKKEEQPGFRLVAVMTAVVLTGIMVRRSR
jgi:hypothetical protein